MLYHHENLQKSKQNNFMFSVLCSVHKSYKTRKWTSSCIGNLFSCTTVRLCTYVSKKLSAYFQVFSQDISHLFILGVIVVTSFVKPESIRGTQLSTGMNVKCTNPLFTFPSGSFMQAGPSYYDIDAVLEFILFHSFFW